jgi:hypothetical protein
MLRWLAVLYVFAQSSAHAADPSTAGLIPKARQAIKVDGALDDWSGAFVTPLNTGHPNLFNRAAHVYWLWDEQALYIGLRALDAAPAHVANDNSIYDGDAIEFYLDTRQGADLGNPEFKPGTLHMFFTALTGKELKPRYGLRAHPTFATLKLKGVEMAAAKTPDGYALEFKLPWSNFPGFTPKPGTPLGIDVELCSSDGGKRVFRTFTYSSPESVQTPAAFGRVKLVDTLDPDSLASYSRALMPMDVQMPGNYGWIQIVSCVSPTIAKSVGKVAVRLVDAEGRVRKSAVPKDSLVAGHWNFVRAELETFDVAPGTYTLLLTAFAAGGATIAERSMKVVLPP